MRIKFFGALSTAILLSLFILGSAGGDVYAQGRGHGGGHGGGGGHHGGGGGGDRGGNRGGNWGGNRGGGQQRGGPPGQMRKQEVRPQWQPQQQSRGGGWQRRQQPQMRPQPQMRVWQQRPQPQRQARQQVFREQRQRQQQQVFRQPQRVFEPRMERRQDQNNGRWRGDRGNGRGNGRGRDNNQGNNNQGNGRWRREERPGGQMPFGRLGPVWGPPGRNRSAEVHQRNALRRAEREADRGYRGTFLNRQPFYQQQYYQPYYRERYSAYDQRAYVTPIYPYASTIVTEPYYDDYNGGIASYSPIYLPNYYAYAPYSAYDRYSDTYLPDNYDYYGYDPEESFGWKTTILRTLVGFVLGNFENDYYGAQPYDTYYASSPGAYGYDNYGSYAGYDPAPYYSESTYSYTEYEDPLINTIPVGELIGPNYCGYSSGLRREVLAQGYEQGYYAGRHSHREHRKFLKRLYSIDNDFYSPYSDTISENRRVFAEGYSLGYQDALSGNDDYVSNYGGDADLFSLLTSNIIGL